MDPIEKLIDEVSEIKGMIKGLANRVSNLENRTLNLEFRTAESFDPWSVSGLDTPTYDPRSTWNPNAQCNGYDVEVATYEDLTELLRLMTKLGVSDDLKNRVLTSTTGYLRRNPPETRRFAKTVEEYNMNVPLFNPAFTRTGGFVNPDRNDAVDSWANFSEAMYKRSNNITPDQVYGKTNSWLDSVSPFIKEGELMRNVQKDDVKNEQNRKGIPAKCMCGQPFVIDTSESTRFNCPRCGKTHTFFPNNPFGDQSLEFGDVPKADDVAKSIIESIQENAPEKPKTEKGKKKTTKEVN